MKRSSLTFSLLGVFAVSAALAVCCSRMPDLISSLFAFPFEPIGDGLRALSLSGRVGNALSLLLLGAFTLLPIGYALGRKGKEVFRGEMILLCLLGLLLGGVLYLMANPTLLYSWMLLPRQEMLGIYKAMFGGLVWSLAVLWAVLRILSRFRSGEVKVLLGYLRSLLMVLALVLAAAAAFGPVKTAVTALSPPPQNNLSAAALIGPAVSSPQPTADGFMAVVLCLGGLVPYGFDIVVIFSALRLIDAFSTGEQSETVKSADALSRRCRMALGCVCGITVVLNVLQLLFSKELSNVAVNVNIPVLSLVFLLLLMLLSRLVAENRRLKDDNELFI